MDSSSKPDWLSHAAQSREQGRTWTASAVVFLPIRSSTSMEKRPSVILPTTMASTNGNGQRSEELKRRLCKPIGSSVKGACSSTHEKLQQQSFLSPTIVDARSITPEEFNKMAAVATGKVTKGSDVSSPRQCEFLQAGQVFLTQNNMNTGFAFASSTPFLTSHVQRYENHPPEAIQQSLASLKKGLVEYLSRAKAAKEKGLTETERSNVSETATKPLAQKPWRGKPFSCSTKGTAVPAATIKPLPATTRNDDVVKYHVVSKPQPHPGPRTIYKVPNAELPEIKPIDLSQAGTYNSSDNQASLKEEINNLKEKIVETEKDLQKIGNGKNGLVSETTDFSQQEEPIDLTVSKKSSHVAAVPSSATQLHNNGQDCSDNITGGKRSLRASTKTSTLATRNSLLQDKNRKRKRKPSVPFHRSGEFGKASTNNGHRMMSPGKSGCPTVGKRGRLDEMVQALSKRLDDAYIPSYGIEHR